MAQGKFVTLEGGEGAGKTTQAEYLKDFFLSCGKQVLLTREPGGSFGAELIRPILLNRDAYSWDSLTEYLLFSAARRDHILKTIKPALEKGIWVICDRFYDSSVVYQGYGKHIDLEVLQTIYNFISEGIKPDLTFIFNITPKIGLKRAQKRADHEDRFEQMGLKFHDDIQEGFLRIARTYPERCHVIDAEKDVLEIKEKIQTIIQSRLL